MSFTQRNGLFYTFNAFRDGNQELPKFISDHIKGFDSSISDEVIQGIIWIRKFLALDEYILEFRIFQFTYHSRSLSWCHINQS